MAYQIGENCGSKNHRWNGGKTTCNGYLYLFVNGHHRANSYGYVAEHVLIAEKAYEKSLQKSQEIHHADYDRSNNENKNLVICEDKKFHKLLHRRTDALRAIGDVNGRKCIYCKEWDIVENLYIPKSGYSPRHQRCNSLYRKRRRSWKNYKHQ